MSEYQAPSVARRRNTILVAIWGTAFRENVMRCGTVNTVLKTDEKHHSVEMNGCQDILNLLNN
jgi:hypothetical protein